MEELHKEDKDKNFRNYLYFYKQKCKRRILFELNKKFVEAVETKFKVNYLKDYVFATVQNEKLLNKLNYVNLDFESSWR